jgi:hypothetical protein
MKRAPSVVQPRLTAKLAAANAALAKQQAGVGFEQRCDEVRKAYPKLANTVLLKARLAHPQEFEAFRKATPMPLPAGSKLNDGGQELENLVDEIMRQRGVPRTNAMTLARQQFALYRAA